MEMLTAEENKDLMLLRRIAAKDVRKVALIGIQKGLRREDVEKMSPEDISEKFIVTYSANKLPPATEKVMVRRSIGGSHEEHRLFLSAKRGYNGRWRKTVPSQVNDQYGRINLDYANFDDFESFDPAILVVENGRIYENPRTRSVFSLTQKVTDPNSLEEIFQELMSQNEH